MFAVPKDFFPVSEGMFAVPKDLFPVSEGMFAVSEYIFPVLKDLFPVSEGMFLLLKDLFPVPDEILSLNCLVGLSILLLPSLQFKPLFSQEQKVLTILNSQIYLMHRAILSRKEGQFAKRSLCPAHREEWVSHWHWLAIG